MIDHCDERSEMNDDNHVENGTVEEEEEENDGSSFDEIWNALDRFPVTTIDVVFWISSLTFSSMTNE